MNEYTESQIKELECTVRAFVALSETIRDRSKTYQGTDAESTDNEKLETGLYGVLLERLICQWMRPTIDAQAIRREEHFKKLAEEIDRDLRILGEPRINMAILLVQNLFEYAAKELKFQPGSTLMTKIVAVETALKGGTAS